MKRFLGGIAAALYVVACFLPGEPSGAERIQFTLDFPVPYRVPIAGVVEPRITISVGDQALKDPSYRLESLDPSVVRVVRVVTGDSGSLGHQVAGAGRGLEGVARGTASVRVVYPTATGAADTVFAVRVVVAWIALESAPETLTRLGQTAQLNATARDAWGGVVPNVLLTWSSSDPQVATVSSTGLVTALDEGTVTITAAADDVAATAVVTVLQTAAQVRVAPALDTVRTVRRSTQFIAVAFDSTGTILSDAKASWSSSNPSVATVDATGLATAESAGTARIIARVGSAADTATIVVKQVLRFLVVVPVLDTLTAIDDTGRVSAIGTDSLGSTIPDLVVTWATGDTTIAVVDQTGLVQARANGVVLVTASSRGQAAFATVVVRQEVVAARLSQRSVTLTGEGDTVRLSATALDRNGYHVAGAAFTWRSSRFGCVATVDAAGLVTARGGGSAEIVVAPANGGKADTAAVTVGGPPSPCPLIAFQSRRGIELMRADGSERSVLIAGAVGDPAWSPDGSRLAYTRTFGIPGCMRPCFTTEVYTASADGSAPRNITNNPAGDADPTWSPDGTRIAFASSRDGLLNIYVMNADGSGVTRVTRLTDHDFGPAWSPDGTKIAFSSSRGDSSDIYITNADGTGVTRLTNDYPARSIYPAWSPDGSQLAFGSSRDGTYDIWLMNPDGSGARNLTASPGSVEGRPAWSPDGTRIAFYSQLPGSDLDLYVINWDGTGLQQLTSTPDVSENSPAWRPTPPPPGSRGLTAARAGPKR